MTLLALPPTALRRHEHDLESDPIDSDLIDSDLTDTDLMDTEPIVHRRLRRADDGMGTTFRLSNGNEVALTGFTDGMYYPPNYLEDLRAGRL